MSDVPPPRPNLLLPSSRTALAGLAAAVCNAALRVAIVPIFAIPVFDRVLARNDLSELPGVLALAAAVAIGGSIALWLQDALLARAAADVASTWRRGLFRDLLARTPGTLPGTSGGLASRILTDLREIETYYQYGLGTLVAEGATVVGALAYLFYVNAQATALLVLLGIPGFLVLRVVGRALERVAGSSQEGMESLGRILQEGFRHHDSIRAFGADAFMLHRLRPANETTARHMARRGFLGGAQVPLAQVLVFVAVGLLVVVLASAVRDGAMTAGQTIGYLALVALLATPLQLLPKGYAMLVQARAARTRLASLTGGPAAEAVVATTKRDDTAEGHAAEASPLVFDRVTFAYRDDPVLDDVTLTLPSTGLVTITGPSGGGKTTLLRLALGFLAPTQGEIRAFGRPLRQIPEDQLRRRLAYVPQDRGLDHELREDGEGLSGGQRQRLALARALASDPDVLLLDEPTSNLDGETEEALVAVLAEESRRRLVVAVAHRSSLAEHADVVVHLDGGRLVSTHAAEAAHGKPDAPS